MRWLDGIIDSMDMDLGGLRDVQFLGHEDPLEKEMATHSSLENHMDRGAWWVTVHGVSKELNTT